jgi:hypothetical protein
VSQPVQGLAPFLPPHRPRARARWWVAAGTCDTKRLRIETLGEQDALPRVTALCGLAAPCSLPEAFVDYLGGEADLTASRLLARARAFAADAERGRKHPRRDPHESASALERRRLALFHAARPLLAKVPVLPRAAATSPCLFEVDARSLLTRLELPATGLAGESAAATAKRARVLEALREEVLGLAVDVRARDYAVASWPALKAVLAAGMAAWLHANRPRPPRDVAAWIPLP